MYLVRMVAAGKEAVVVARVVEVDQMAEMRDTDSPVVDAEKLDPQRLEANPEAPSMIDLRKARVAGG